MSSTMRIIMKPCAVPLAAIATALLASGAYAAEVSAPAAATAVDAAQEPGEEIQTLDEVWVRGKRLSQVIEDAEDDFFVLYNKLNKNYEYDVFCGHMSLNNGSMIMVRKCVPGFIVLSYSNVYGGFGSGGCGAGGGYFEGSAYTTYSCGGGGFGYSPSSNLVTPPPEAVSMAKRDDYMANVVKVVRSDPRLLEKVENLRVLYQDMELVQGRYVKMKGDGAPPPASRRNSRPYSGPRAT